MTSAVDAGHPLYPPTVAPSAEPLSMPKFLIRGVRNPLLAMPQAAYEEDIVAFKRWTRPVFWAMAPELVETILVKRADVFQKSPVEKRVFRRTLKDGVLSAEGALWRWQRRTMAPLFRPAEILHYVPRMAKPAEDLLARWRASPQGSVQAIDDDMIETTFAVIALTMLQGGAAREAALINEATASTLAHISWEIIYGILGLPLWVPHPASWLMKRQAARLRGAVGDIIARRQADGGSGGDDLLGSLLAARDPETGAPMTKEQLINNLLTLLEAGHETTSRALTWTLYLLARAPDWQEAVRAEVASVCGSRPIEAGDIQALTITQQVLKESMRLYAPVPLMSRQAITTVELGGMEVPASSVVILPIYCIHRHKALWRDPGRFDPTRFTPEREAAYPRGQFMPFGAGPRICLGSGFAMVEATAILASLVRGARFEWDGRHTPEPVSRVTLQPRGGMPLRVTTLPG